MNRIQGRINQGKIGSIDDVMNVLEKGTKYTDTVNGGTVMFKDGISIHIAEDGTMQKSSQLGRYINDGVSKTHRFNNGISG